MDDANVAFVESIELAVSFAELNLPEQYNGIEFVVSVNKNDAEIER